MKASYENQQANQSGCSTSFEAKNLLGYTNISINKEVWAENEWKIILDTVWAFLTVCMPYNDQKFCSSVLVTVTSKCHPHFDTSIFHYKSRLFTKLPPQKKSKSSDCEKKLKAGNEGENINDFHPHIHNIICVNLRKLMKLTTNLIWQSMRKNSRTKYDICARKKEYVLHCGSSKMEIR